MPWIEFQKKTDSNEYTILLLTIITPAALLLPIAVGPVVIGLIYRPMVLATNIIDILERHQEDDYFGYTLPAWFSSCLEDTSPIMDKTEPVDFSEEVH